MVSKRNSVVLAGGSPPEAAMREWADALVARSRAEGVDLVGTNGLLTSLERSVLQTGMEVELADHLGYEPYEAAGRGSGNSRNGYYPKTVSTEIGDIELAVPRDGAGTFEPVKVPKGALYPAGSVRSGQSYLGTANRLFGFQRGVMVASRFQLGLPA